ncbi:MAG: methyl-accepting chemotaxis protein [Magnetococcus sp. YQC-5]
MKRLYGIKYQFLIPFQGVLLVGLFLIGHTAFVITEQAVIDSALLTMQNHLEQVINQTEAFHSKAKSDMALAMEHPVFQEYFALPDTRAGTQYNPNKIIQFTQAQREVKRQLDQWTLVLQKRFPIVETCLIDRNGQEHMRITKGEIAPDEDYSSEENSSPFFEPTFGLNAGEVHVAEPYMSADANEFVFAYTSPVVLPDGSKPGFYHIEIALARFQEVIQNKHQSRQNDSDNPKTSSRLLIVNADGLIIADSMRQIDLRRKTSSDTHQDATHQPTLAEYLPTIHSISKSPDLASSLTQIKAGQGGWNRFRQDGELFYAVYQPMSTFGWSVMEIKNYEELLTGKYSLTRIKGSVFLISFIILVIASIITWFVANQVTRPIRTMLALVAEMTKGDLTQRIPLPTTQNEVLDIALGINNMVNAFARNIRMIHLHGGSVTAFIKEILKIRKVFSEQANILQNHAMQASAENQRLAVEVTRIHDAINQMQSATWQADETSRQLAEQIVGMTTTTAEVSQDVTTVATSTRIINNQLENMSQQLNSSTQAVDQMAEAIGRLSDSFEQIGGLTDRSTQESAQAERLAMETRDGMHRLSLAAGEINSVVEMINSISEQTNMLSINATIEAAGAGQFGKGFAVVASEVKTLARQTGEATQKIFERIHEIQEMALQMVSEVERLASNIQHLHQGNREISNQVANQVTETKKISMAVADLVKGADESSESARQLGMALDAASQAAFSAAQRTEEIANTSVQASSNANHVSQQNTAISTFANEIQDAVQKTSAASEHVLNEMENSQINTRYLIGVIAHFHSLSDVARQISVDLFNSQTGMDIGLEPFNIRRMKEIHLNLMGQLAKTLFGKGELDPNVVGQADVCPMGCMLAAETTLHHSANYQRIVGLHARGHTIAAEVVNAMAKERPKEAQEALQRFRQIGESLFAELNLLYLDSETLKQSDGYIFWNGARHDTGWASLNIFHEGMVERMNRIYVALRDQLGNQQIAVRINEMLAFCEPQFLAEQQEMARLHCQELESHKKEHDFFRWKTLDIMSQFHEDEFSIQWDLLHFLHVWLVRHVARMDMHLGHFLIAQKKLDKKISINI